MILPSDFIDVKLVETHIRLWASPDVIQGESDKLDLHWRYVVDMTLAHAGELKYLTSYTCMFTRVHPVKQFWIVLFGVLDDDICLRMEKHLPGFSPLF